jgi:hypothetical protein
MRPSAEASKRSSSVARRAYRRTTPLTNPPTSRPRSSAATRTRLTPENDNSSSIVAITIDAAPPCAIVAKVAINGPREPKISDAIGQAGQRRSHSARPTVREPEREANKDKAPKRRYTRRDNVHRGVAYPDRGQRQPDLIRPLPPYCQPLHGCLRDDTHTCRARPPCRTSQPTHSRILVIAAPSSVVAHCKSWPDCDMRSVRA